MTANQEYGPFNADDMQAYAAAVVRDALERAAISAWSTGMDEHNKAVGMPCDAREVGSRCAERIRALLKEYE